MKFFVKNVNDTIWFTQNVMRLAGLLLPENLTDIQKILWRFYTGFWITITVGIYAIVQTGDLIQIWGNLTLMTETLFLLLTSFAFLVKLISLMMKDKVVQSVINEGDDQLKTEDRLEGKVIMQKSNQVTTRFLYLYALITVATVFGWVASAEKNQLPIRAWYPYDISKSPAYELTYIHQGLAGLIMGLADDSFDVLVSSMTAVCRCRLQLLALSLRTTCQDIIITDKMLTPEQEKTVCERLRHCVLQHQMILEAAVKIQTCFSVPILVQFTMSMVILCVSAYQLVFENGDNLVRLMSMTTYLIGMVFRVYIYCHQADLLTKESFNIADAAYECPWYVYPVPLRRALLVIMARSRRITVLSVGGFTTVSLDCFMSIIKASYSFFTVLQQVEHE